MQKKIDKALDDLINGAIGVISLRDKGFYTQEQAEQHIERHKRDAKKLLDALYDRKCRIYSEVPA